MSRRSTALPRGGHFSLTCDSCWDGFNSFGPRWDDVEREAQRTSNGDREVFGTELEADARGEWLVASGPLVPVVMAVTYRVEVED